MSFIDIILLTVGKAGKPFGFDAVYLLIYIGIILFLSIGVFLLYGYLLEKFMRSGKYEQSTLKCWGVGVVGRYRLHSKETHELLEWFGSYRPIHWWFFLFHVFYPWAVYTIFCKSDDVLLNSQVSKFLIVYAVFALSLFFARMLRIGSLNGGSGPGVFIISVTLLVFLVISFLNLHEFGKFEGVYWMRCIVYSLDFFVNWSLPEVLRKDAMKIFGMRRLMTLGTYFYKLDIVTAVIIGVTIFLIYGTGILAILLDSDKDDEDRLYVVALLFILMAIQLYCITSFGSWEWVDPASGASLYRLFTTDW